ncbi:hypothetical protein TrLO_g4235 [Triparma laevis f. longispina]|uniref:Uncharacterized protein n=1 Tax=Triparma laevis f. longispina TaxID=1714387 RepID=A0A9W7AMW6_9STRA|nr:hypothetical protein TrLO_g4235 [Triparma laevis f. longispina]
MLVQLHHPQEVGGLPFLFSTVYSLVGSFFSVYLYTTHYDGPAKLDEGTLQVALGSLYAICLDTASDFNKTRFLSLREDEDESNSITLKWHLDIYKKWGDELIKPWTLENWTRWETEKPSWFTDDWIKGVRNEFIPFEYRVKYKKTKGRVETQN